MAVSTNTNTVPIMKVCVDKNGQREKKEGKARENAHAEKVNKISASENYANSAESGERLSSLSNKWVELPQIRLFANYPIIHHRNIAMQLTPNSTRYMIHK